MSRFDRRNMIVLLVGAFIAFSDQTTKHLVRNGIPLDHRIPIVRDFFDLTHIENTGAAWGMFSGLNEWLALTGIVALILVIVFRRSFLCDAVASPTALGLMIGGILGNLIDRLSLFCVVDFLDFHWRSHHFPAFNVADSAICVGVALYLFSSLRHQSRCAPATDKAPDGKERAGTAGNDVKQ